MGEALFLHVPKSASKPDIMFIPLGTLALASFLRQKGHKASVVNVFVEKRIDSSFDAVEYAKMSEARIFCLPLHWHFQAYDVLSTAERLKQAIPGSKIVLGGFTATFFAEDIIKHYPFVDFVIKGDSEIPLLNIVEGKEPRLIPNLVWREGKEVVSNRQSYKLDKEMIDSLTFTDFSVISRFEEYQKLGLPKEDSSNSWLFVYNPGAGCNVNCSYCGGSCSSQKRINLRESAIFVSLERAVSELKRLAANSMGVWYVCFDPDPERSYYLELFRRLENEGIKIRCKFEAWSLPSREFIESFKSTFAGGSEIMVSPDTGSERARKANKGFFYTNERLIECLRQIEEAGIGSLVYFTAGLPSESMKDFLETLKLINRIRTEFRSAKVFAVPIEIEPGSPMFMNPGEYRIKTSRKGIRDFYAVHKEQSSVGYETEHFTSEEIAELANLARAAAGCLMKRPVFLKALDEAPFTIEEAPVKELWRFCAVCKFFNRCFA